MRRTPLLILPLLLLACGDDDGGTTDASTHDGGPPRPMDGGAPCIGCGACLDVSDTTAFEQTLIELPGATWYEAPGTSMRDVCIPDSVGVRGVVGCTAVISAWSSGAYDSGRRRMIVWGGGHNDYWGNELYAFDLRTGAWSRVTEPSTIPAGTDPGDFLNRDPLPDGQPVSRHTYDGVEYLPDLDVLWGHGGSRASDGSGTSRTWRFDAATVLWSMGADGPGGYSNGCAYDAAGRRMFVKAAESLHIYDVDGDSWSAVDGFGYPPLWPRYAEGGDKTGAFDPTRGLFWSVGSGEIMVWDAATNGAVTDDWVTTGGGDYSNADTAGDRPDQLFEGGGGEIYDASAPGFDYDIANDAFVAWPNAGAPYALDLETRTWTAGSPSGAPTSETSGGTYGRWRYVDAYNVFILVNSVDENVYFYKHTPGCGG